MSFQRPRAPMHPAALDRRTLLRAASLIGLGAAPTLTLAACGGSSPAPSSGTTASKSPGGAPNYGPLAVQLSWVKTTTFAGMYYADSQGYYTDAGFTAVDLVSGGAAGTSAEAALVTGKTFAAQSSPILTAPAILQGAPLKTVGAAFQKNPYCILSLATAPIPTPVDMVGKRIGVQSGGNDQVFAALLAANDIDPATVTAVPVQYDATVLVSGEVDGYMAFVVDEPLSLRAQGVETVNYLLADQGLPFVTETFVVTQDSIDTEREKVKAYLRAQVRGWSGALDHPEEAARLAVQVYGKDLDMDLSTQVTRLREQTALMVSTDTVANGLCTMTGELMEQTVTSLGITGTKIAAEDLFDMSLLSEVFQEDPSLKESPTAAPPAA